jgi:hypothetical protein
MVRHWRTVTVCVIVAVALVVWFVRSGLAGAPRPSAADLIKSSLREGARAYKPLAMVPIAEARPGWLASAPIDDRSGMRVDHAALRREVEEFVRRRLVEQDFEAYVAWRLERGWRWKSVEELQATWHIREAYQAVIGRPAPNDLDVRGFMAALWDTGLAGHAGENRPVALARDRTGQTVTIGRTNDPADHCQTLDGELGPETWHGPTCATLRRWFHPPTSPKELFRRHGTLVTATVGVVVELQSGDRQPYMFSFFHDPERAAWMLMEVNRSHYADPARVTPLEF